ncbi:DNA-binding transcriptional regulator, MarR family [Devosia crocina]|uniref:DNA-binding transcriptional regulator, MarR family n=1 Tax=Devosia crocina TaxID=429728 RepID=A0A1I7NJ85_9HYPH|nr:MarR family transcriptional regulator [Devosia crocina]SFV34646.1 DNA-binding transcriptional regulator, MarR family [Devosia crocina]
MDNVQNTHIDAFLPELLRSVIDIVGLFNEPERDAAMLGRAGLSLERALFPLLVLIDKLGPVGVVDLADRIGRDHTTVSRQVARLEQLGLVSRQPSLVDRRVREATITPLGRNSTAGIDATRHEMAHELFDGWSRQDFDDLVRLTRMLADGMRVTKRRAMRDESQLDMPVSK